MKKLFTISTVVMLGLLFAQMIPANSITSVAMVDAVKIKNDDKTIVDIASKDERFKTLVDLLKTANLVDLLQGEGPFTVFAPVNDAFAKLPKETVAELLKPENKDKLADILKYHVVPGKITSKDIIELNGKQLKMSNGKVAKIEVKNGDIYINGAKIIVTNIETDNGVIHVIDTVILP